MEIDGEEGKIQREMEKNRREIRVYNDRDGEYYTLFVISTRRARLSVSTTMRHAGPTSLRSRGASLYDMYDSSRWSKTPQLLLV